jgi:hypothetical protein
VPYTRAAVQTGKPIRTGRDRSINSGEALDGGGTPAPCFERDPHSYGQARAPKLESAASADEEVRCLRMLRWGALMPESAAAENARAAGALLTIRSTAVFSSSVIRTVFVSSLTGLDLNRPGSKEAVPSVLLQ